MSVHQHDSDFIYKLDKQFTSRDYDPGEYVRYVHYHAYFGLVLSLIPPFVWVLSWQVEFPGKVRCALLFAVLLGRLAAGGPGQLPPRLNPPSF